MLGVYRPKEHGAVPSVLVLHGKDGPRRLYEDLANRYAGKGFIAIVACWFAYSAQQHADAYACPGIGDFHGAEATTVTDVNDIVDATKRVRGVEKNQLGIVGQSYGARMALLRAAATGSMEPIVSSCGYLASQPLTLEAETPVYPFPADPDVAARIKAPVLVVHGDADPIIPVGQADVFAKAMSDAEHPISLITYSAPADHSIPWDVVTGLDDPQRLLRDRFLGDTVTWLRQRLLESSASKKDATSTT
jgi:dienelactone hydrolase